MDWINAWLFPVGSVLLGGLGLLLLVRGVFGRRFVVRKTRACRRCRYDMTATEGHHCPECGYTAGHEGEHYAGRRRWLVAGFGVVLLAGAVGASRWREIHHVGWWSVMPVRVQLRALVFSDDERLWRYLAQSSVANNLAADQEAHLRRVMLDRLLDHRRDPAPVIDGAAYVMTWTRRVDPLLTDDDLVRIVREGPPAARAFAIDVIGYPIPETDADFEIRRRAWSEASAENRREMLKWIARHAVGDEDISILRQALKDDPWQAQSVYQEVVEESTGELVSVLSNLLEDPDPDLRMSAALCFQQWMMQYDVKPPVEVQRRLLEMLVRDTDLRVIGVIDRMIDDMSNLMGPEIGSAVLEVTDQIRFEGLMHGILRRDDSEIVPYLLRAARQTGRPLVQRLEAAEGAWYVWERTQDAGDAPMPDPADAELVHLYATAIDAFRRSDADMSVFIGRITGFRGSPWMPRAIALRAAEAEVGRGAINEWLSEGSLGYALSMSYGMHIEPVRPFRWGLSNGLKRGDRDSDSTLRPAAVRWFPDLLAEEAEDLDTGPDD